MGASRRDVLKASILLPMMASAAGIDGVSEGVPMRVVVVGAGAFGGWTALYLLRRGARVTLLDAWGPGNSRASSGGETRVIRGTYGPDRVYTRMADGKFLKFDESGNKQTAAALQATKKTDHLRANVVGERKGDQIAVSKITLD